jgi:hypothetical protein
MQGFANRLGCRFARVCDGDCASVRERALGGTCGTWRLHYIILKIGCHCPRQQHQYRRSPRARFSASRFQSCKNSRHDALFWIQHGWLSVGEGGRTGLMSFVARVAELYTLAPRCEIELWPTGENGHAPMRRVFAPPTLKLRAISTMKLWSPTTLTVLGNRPRADWV